MAPFVETLEAEASSISLLRATAYSLLVSTGYVGVLYLKKSARPSSTTNRNDRAVITTRLIFISIYTLVSIFLLVPGILTWIEHAYPNYLISFSSLRVFWGWPVHNTKDENDIILSYFEVALYLIFDVLKALLLTSVLFIGPLTDYFYFDRVGPNSQEYNNSSGPLSETTINKKRLLSFASPKTVYTEIVSGLSTLVGVRNFVIGPLTEEFVYRSCVLAFHLSAINSSHVSSTYMIFVTPLYFGVAHLHHAYEMYLESRYPLQVIGFISLFQLLFTSVFGWYASFLFLRFGSVWPPVFVHAFCNAVGPPTFNQVGNGKVDTWIYRGLLVAGLVAFSRLLFVLTESPFRIM